MTLRAKIAMAFVAVNLLFFTGWAVSEAVQFSSENVREITVKTRPVDPRDLLSGNYFILNYDITRVNNYENHEQYGYRWSSKRRNVWAVLKKEEEFYVPHMLYDEMPRLENHDHVVLRGTFKRGNIDFGVGKFFINENMKEPSRSDMRKTTVVLKVSDKGNVRIKEVYVDGVEYFSTQR